MGELGVVRRYAYWSDRRVRSIAADNAIVLDQRWRLGFKTPSAGIAPQAEIAQDRRTLQRHEIAVKVERAIGSRAVEDFITPPPASFAKGCTEMTLAAYTRWYGAKKKSKRKAVIAHTRTMSSDGSSVEIILFASIEHCAGYLSGKKAEAPYWSSSSTEAIEEFIAHKGAEPATIYDDDESIAYETVRVMQNESMTDKYVFKRIVAAEWFAEIYHDVVLDKEERWHFRPDDPQPDRIVIGAPLWIRSYAG
jgi:hypothetical protein